MNEIFRNTLSPIQWAILAAIPPAILALYFLKLKRAPVEVPSTYLWRQSIEDLRVNSFWQRLRQSLLLFLQLLIVALAILALLRPGWQGTQLTGERVIFVIDNSASMNASDVSAAENRLALAKQRVGELIEQLDHRMSAMIIAFADSPQVVQDFTGNQGLLKERLASIQPTSEPTDLREALELAGGLANPAQMPLSEVGAEVEVIEPVDSHLYIFSDGRFADVEGFDLGRLVPVYVPIGSTNAGNLAITAFSTRRSESQLAEQEAFVQVSNLTDQDQSFEIELQLEDQFLDAKSGTVAAGETAALTFRLADAPPGKLTARLDAGSLAQAQDKLLLDNVAYAALDEAERGQVLLVTQGNLVLQAALSTERIRRLAQLESISPDELSNTSYQSRAASGEFDLVIYDACRPAEMPRAHTLFIGQIPPTADWHSQSDGEQAADPTAAEETQVSFPQVIDWNRAHPLLAYVDLNDLWVYQSQVLSPPKSATLLVESNVGPLMAVAPRESYEDVVLGFPIIVQRDGSAMGNTRWFRRRSFPTFWLNSLSYLVGQLGGQAARQTSPGKSIEFRPRANVPQVTVRTPSGREIPLQRSGDRPFQFQDTSELGVYQVLERGSVVQRFAVNLFNRQESDIRLRSTEDAAEAEIASIRIGFTDVTAQAAAAPARKELWPWLLVAAVAVVMGEWWVYNRRVYL